MNLTEAIIDLTKAFGVGTIRTWANGKKYQKQANGKWVEFVQTKDRSEKQENTPKTQKEELNDLISEVKSNFPDVSLSIYLWGGYLNISKIALPKGERSKGQGTAIMNKFLVFADNNGITSSLTPSSDYGGSLSRLKEFYKRFGFLENKGKNKDFGTTESMIRPPKTEKKEERSSTYEEDYKYVSLNLRNSKNITEKNAYSYLAISGIPKGFNGDVSISKRGGIVTVSCNNESLTMFRKLDTINKTIDNHSFFIRKESKYKGVDIFINQVKNAQKEGYKEMYVLAGGNSYDKDTPSNMNGYYTWLRFGYVPDKEQDNEYVEWFNEDFEDEGLKIKSVTELMYSKEGRHWWVENGGEFKGKFDLSENSYSMKTLNNYIDEKEKKGNS